MSSSTLKQLSICCCLWREMDSLWRRTHASPLVPGEWGCECGGPLGLAGHSLFPRWVQVSTQCSPQHLPSLFPCWWLYGVKGIRLSGSRKASGARPSINHTAARALCGAPMAPKVTPPASLRTHFSTHHNWRTCIHMGIYIKTNKHIQNLHVQKWMYIHGDIQMVSPESYITPPGVPFQNKNNCLCAAESLSLSLVFFLVLHCRLLLKTYRQTTAIGQTATS